MSKEVFITLAEFKSELKKLILLAIPLVASYTASCCMRIFTVIFVGQYLTTDDLDGVALGNTMTNITGVSMIIGFVSPMDSLCTQAFGAKNWKLYSITVYRAVICSTVYLIPIVVLWCYIYDILICFGYNIIVANKAYEYAMIYIGVLPAFVVLSVTRRFLSSQSIAKPLIYIGGIVYVIWHPFSLWLCYGYFEQKHFKWAPLCNVFTTYLNISLIILYCLIRKPHNPLTLQRVSLSDILKWKTNWKINTFINKNVVNNDINIDVIDKGLKEFVVLSIAGVFSMCGEWWSWEIVTFMSGLLGPTQLAVHVIYATVLPLYYMIPLGVGLAGAARIGALIGENRQHLAKKLSEYILWFTLFEGILLAIISFCVRYYIPLLFTNDIAVINIAIRLNPLFCGMTIFDAMQGSMQGVLRGIKQQGKSVIGVWIGPWLITLPLGAFLAFDKFINLKIFGMWIANNIGYLTMDLIFLYIFITYKWDNQNSNESDSQKLDNCIQYNGLTKKQDNIKNANLPTMSSVMNISHFSAFVGLNML